jgi:hypothetical protein
MSLRKIEELCCLMLSASFQGSRWIELHLPSFRQGEFLTVDQIGWKHEHFGMSVVSTAKSDAS